MKTAEEWLVEMGIEIDTGHVPPQTQLTMSAAIKKIQLDSWKQGMTDAAKVAEDMADKYSMNTRDNSYKWPCERVADNIEMHRDRKTEL